MLFREATVADIPSIQAVRNSVKENMLSDPARIKDSDVAEHLTTLGKGWVCEIDDKIAGFSIVDLKNNNIWALFIRPETEGKGIGKELQRLMLDWYFIRTKQPAWLSTDPGTRAENFYRLQGWAEAGTYGKGEIKFEMTSAKWENTRAKFTRPFSNTSPRLPS